MSKSEASNPPRSRVSRHKSRHVAELSNVPLIGRTALASRVQETASKAPPTKFPNLIAFLEFWKWIVPYLRDCTRPAWPYQTYPVGKTGVFDLTLVAQNGPLTMAVAGDWGTGTLEADTVASNIKACSPHCTLHLGDVYYMGEATEISENCLGTPTSNYIGVYWPYGSLGSFALMGNHEMYSGGEGYFQKFLPRLGLFDPSGTVREPQSASYFCINTPHWLVLGLDTGYHSGGMPWLTNVSGINAIPFLNVNARFDEKLMTWLNQLAQTLKANGSAKKSVLVLTHHQPISSFEHAFSKPVKQLAKWDFLHGKEFVWLYGHEHRLTVYGKRNIANSLRVYPRCIGHGGMPVKVTKLTRPDSNILFYDPRQHPIDKDHPDKLIGYNGHIVLKFKDTSLMIEYHDIADNKLLLTETFTPNDSGALEHLYSRPSDSSLFSGQQTS